MTAPILLIQVRDDATAESQEVRCFANRCGLPEADLERINVVERPDIQWDHVAHAGVLLLGGAGRHSAVEDYPFTEPLTRVIRRWIDESRPFFGSCWGHQFLARALGGQVIHDRQRGEIGTHDIELTEAGREDLLFLGLPDRLPAHMGHHDRVAQLPETMVELARSELCPNQTIRVRDKPAYGTQFHSEMGADDFRKRLGIYREEYLAPGSDLEQIGDMLRPAPDVEGLRRRFLKIYA